MFRTRSLDGALHGFDPVSGLNAHIAGPVTRDHRANAPRSVQISVTNHCNLACSFCYRDTTAESRWTVESLTTLLRDLHRAGVDEVAFGGGEPFAFKGFVGLLHRLYRAHASNNSGSYTLVGAVPSHELAATTVEEILAVSEAQSAWLKDEQRKKPSPLEQFVTRHGLTDRELGEDDWPDHGTVEAIAVGHQVIVYVDWTVTMPPFFGELLYRRGGRVSFEQVHAHGPTIVEGMIWRPGMWQRTARVENDAMFERLDEELREVLPGMMLELRKDTRLLPVYRKMEGPGLAFTAIFTDLVAGVAAVNALVERHGAKLQVRLASPPVEGTSDPLEAYRKRGRGHGRHQVVLWRVGDDRVGVMKAVRDGVAIGLDEVKSRIEQLPWIVSDGLAVEEARALAQALRDAGADATVALV